MPDNGIVPHANSGEELNAWNTPAMDALYDQIRAAAVDAPALDPVDLIPAPLLTPPVDIPAPDQATTPETPVIDTPAPNEAEQALLAANTAAIARVEALGGLDEIDLMVSVAAPFMDGDLNAQAALDAIEKARGPQIVAAFAKGVTECFWSSVVKDVVNRDGEAIINSLLYTAAEIETLEPAAKTIAQSIRQSNPALTQKVANFRAGNGLALGTSALSPRSVPSLLTGQAPTNGVAHPAVAALPTIDPKDYDDQVEGYVQAATSLAAYTGTLEAQVKQLQSQVDEIKTTTVKSAADLQREAERVAEDRIYTEVNGVVLNLTRNLQFSTETDPGKAEKENSEIKADIGHLAGTKFLAAVSRDRDQAYKPAAGTPGETFDRARAALARKDNLGKQVRQDLQDLKKLMNAITVDLLPRFNSRVVAAQTETPVTPPPTRVEVSGPGSGAAPQLPAPSNGPTGSAWDTSSMIRQYNQGVAQRGQRPA